MSNAFNADQYLEAIEPPTLTVHGKTYRGKILSHDEWMRFAPDLEALARHKLDYRQTRLLIARLAYAMFPPSRWWRVWERSGAHHLLNLPFQAQMDAMKGFLKSQSQALGIRVNRDAEAAMDPQVEDEPQP